MGNKPRISIRLTNNQELVLKELSETLGVSISMLIRTIVGDWLSQKEDAVYRLIDRKKLEQDPSYVSPENNNYNIFEE